MPQAKQPPQAEKIIEFAKRSSNSQDYKDHYISTNAGPLLGRRVYCIEWGYDKHETSCEYWCYVAAPIDNPTELEYYDDETAMFHSLSNFSSEMDTNYRIERFRQQAELALDVFAGLIAVAITATVIGTIFWTPRNPQDLGQLWNIFAVIIGYYFGKAVAKKSPSSAA